jgi:hypothetical protein
MLIDPFHELGLENWLGDSNEIVFTLHYINAQFCTLQRILLTRSLNNLLVLISTYNFAYGVVI